MRVDGIVAIGGGSSIGLSKALALRTDWPQSVIPTTYAGSEATPVLGETIRGAKQTQRSMRVLPESIIYDVELTLALPIPTSMASGINAMAHAAEALYASNPLTNLLAREAISVLLDALPRIHARMDDVEARARALYGAWLCGCCLATVGMALHHKICHTLGGAYGLPHAQMHAVLLPHALAYNLPFAPHAHKILSELLGSSEPAVACAQFARRLQLPQSLRELGMPQIGIESAADLAARNSYPNPRPIERKAICRMLARAWAGDLPPTVPEELADA
jgi:alcohol dehydrogenase class IV